MSPSRLLITVALVASVAGTAIAQTVLIVPGRSVGPVQVGMASPRVLRLLGRPAVRAGDALWSYEQPISLRIEFAAGRVKSIATWDRRARTAQGLAVGVPDTMIVRSLGAPEVLPAFPGAWLYYRALGLAVFVQGGFASAFTVLAPAPPGPPPGAPLPGPRPPSP